MDYQLHYDRLINTRKQRKRVEGQYYERHHTVPKSMCGTNNTENLIYLTAREHFLAHLLLWKIYKNRKMVLGFVMMTRFKTLQIGRKTKILSRQYSIIREALSTKGVSNETRHKLSLCAKGSKRSIETRIKMSKSLIGNSRVKGKKQSESHKQKYENLISVKFEVKNQEKILEKLKLVKKLSEEHKKKISEQTSGINNPMYGKKMLEETRYKMREAWKRRKLKSNE